ncbi:MAG TPA: hypothetical protein VJS12_02785 [Steroidobacteraceae bacterium]|nr:hypothetical protein [Steroidobacteraceae bacterium]
MTFSQLAGLAVRLFALWLLLFCLQALATALALKNTLGELTDGQSVLALSPALIAFALGIFLWKFPLGVARLLIPRGAEQATDITLREGWRLGSVLIGLLTLAAAAPSVLRMIAFIVLAARQDYGAQPLQTTPDLVFALAKLAVGLLLVFCSDFIYRRFGMASRLG